MPLYTIHPEDSGFTLYRGEAPLQTPKSLPVTVPTHALAEGLGAECAAQEERLDLRTMPLMQLTLTAIDITALNRADVLKGILRHGETELLCHTAPEPDELRLSQHATWTPFLDWSRATHKVVWQIGAGIRPVDQRPKR